MDQTSRIHKSFTDLYNGKPWLDVNLSDTLAAITAEEALVKITPSWNAIWEIVHHITEWHKNVLRRLRGEVLTTPDHNYFLPIGDTSEAAWRESTRQLEESQREWAAFLMNDFHESDYDKAYPVNGLSYYDHVQGIIQHDAYHLGQIVMIANHIHDKPGS